MEVRYRDPFINSFLEVAQRFCSADILRKIVPKRSSAITEAKLQVVSSWFRQAQFLTCVTKIKGQSSRSKHVTKIIWGKPLHDIGSKSGLICQLNQQQNVLGIFFKKFLKRAPKKAKTLKIDNIPLFTLSLSICDTKAKRPSNQHIKRDESNYEVKTWPRSTS